MVFGASGSDADGLIGWKIPLFPSRGAGMYPRRKQRDFLSSGLEEYSRYRKGKCG